MYLVKGTSFIILLILFCSPSYSQTASETQAVIDSMITQARALTRERKFDESLKVINDAQAMAIQLYGLNSRGNAAVNTWKARIYSAMGNGGESLKLTLESKDILLEAADTMNADYGNVNYTLCLLYYNAQKFDEAKPYCLSAHSIRTQVLSKDDPELAIVNNSLAVLYRAMGDYDKALLYNLIALDLMNASNNQAHNYYTYISTNLSNLYVELNEFDKAEAIFKENIKAMADVKGRNNAEYARAINNLAVMYKKIGKYDEAESIYLETLEIVAQLYGKSHSEYAKYVASAALFYIIKDDFEKAEAMLIESRNIQINTVGKQNLEYVLNSMNLANLYLENGYYARSESLFKELNQVSLDLVGKEHPTYGEGLGNLGLLYFNQGKFMEAKPWIEEAKAISLNAYGRDHLSTAYMYLMSGNIALETNDFASARADYETAADIREKLVGKNHKDYVEVLTNLAMLETKVGNFAEAEKLLLQSEKTKLTILGENSYTLASTYQALARAYQLNGKIELAEEFWIKNNFKTKTRIQNSAVYSSEAQMQDLLHFFEVQIGQLKSFSQLHPSPEVLKINYDNALYLNGFLLENQKRINESIAHADADIQANFTLWKEGQKKIAYQLSLPSGQQPLLAGLITETEAYEKKLAKDFAAFNDLDKAPKWQDVRDQLKPNDVAIEFVKYPYFNPYATDSVMYAALILKPGMEAPIMIHLFEEGQINAYVDAGNVRKSQYVNKLYSYNAEGNVLYNLIWKPIEKAIGPQKENGTIYFSPSGLLHRLNLNAIPIGPDQRLGDKQHLVELGSTRQLLDVHSPQIKNARAVLVGGIEYEIDSTGTDQKDIVGVTDVATRGSYFEEVPLSLTAEINRGGSWNYLKGTEKEVANIRQIAQNSNLKAEVYAGKMATEEAVKSLSDQKSPYLLHLATHGFFFPKATKDDLDPSAPVFKSSDDPMIRSGLILAGGNFTWKTGKLYSSGREDGILTAKEISQMDLSNTELVVLSACETGLGEVQGDEGVFGLQRAFKLAGAKNLIMSLWQVPDGQTSELMTAFYHHWLEEKMDITTAFNKAQKSIRDKYEHPYFWAGFVLVR